MLDTLSVPSVVAFKTAMRAFASSVLVVTTAWEGRRFGLTATSVCSLSMDPPSLIACVNKNAEAHDRIARSKSFCVNLLTEEQVDIARRFSGFDGHKGADRFDGTDWDMAEDGPPVLRGALAAFECRLVDRSECKSHSLFIGLVTRTHLGDARPPLIYAGRTFTGLRVAVA